MSTINAKLITLYALTPVHSGTGQAVDIVDLPIAREKATNPFLRAPRLAAGPGVADHEAFAKVRAAKDVFKG